MAESGATPLLRMSGITKHYGGVRALQDVHFQVDRGTIHALLGENGAGKSTLIKVLSGVVQPDSGTIEIDGHPVQFANPTEANDAGIACIFQELSLLPDLTVADNIAITRPPRRFGLIDYRAQRRLAEEALARVGGEAIHPSTTVRELPLSRRQMVEIAKALARNPKILILDEATSALTAADVEKVFVMLQQAARGRHGHHLHLASDERDRRTGRYLHGLPQRTEGRNLQGRNQVRQRDRRDDDRP